jgi:hypothetical protein
MSLKDKLDEEPEQVEGWRPENEGDELIGKVLRYNMRKTDDYYEPYPDVTVEQEGGDRNGPPPEDDGPLVALNREVVGS